MRKTVTFSDLTGEPVTDHVQIRLWNGKTEYYVDADLNEMVVQQLISVATTKQRRGRPRKVTA